MSSAATSRHADASNDRTKARTFHHSAFSVQRVAAARAERGLSVSVCLPARECAATVAEIVGSLAAMREAGALDRIVVVDANSSDGTAKLAAAAGAEVWQEAELLPSFGPVLGKGDADVARAVRARQRRWSASWTQTASASRRTSRPL